MTADTFAHALGVASLAVIAGAGGCSVFVLAETVVPNLSKIRAALRGRQAPAAASDAPHAPAIPPLRSAEAAAEPTLEARP